MSLAYITIHFHYRYALISPRPNFRTETILIPKIKIQNRLPLFVIPKQFTSETVHLKALKARSKLKHSEPLHTLSQKTRKKRQLQPLNLAQPIHLDPSSNKARSSSSVPNELSLSLSRAYIQPTELGPYILQYFPAVMPGKFAGIDRAAATALEITCLPRGALSQRESLRLVSRVLAVGARASLLCAGLTFFFLFDFPVCGYYNVYDTHIQKDDCARCAAGFYDGYTGQEFLCGVCVWGSSEIGRSLCETRRRNIMRDSEFYV